MRLINCDTFALEEFYGDDVPKYAILSHTWTKEEVTFAEFTSGNELFRQKEGFKKVYFTCMQALKDGFHYAWIDTCCIDKSSSAELSEAINSMFRWYNHSAKCYVYLADIAVPTSETKIAKSRWFTRGWTLQELIAPAVVQFFDQDWIWLTTKKDAARLISKITKIDVVALLWTCDEEEPNLEDTKDKLARFCAAKRMSWASNRKTTRVEDMAYCLLGIFDVNMPLLYGEGEKAFTRLQEEIIKTSHDESVLAWLPSSEVEHSAESMARLLQARDIDSAFLAPSPSCFKGCENLVYNGRRVVPFTMTNLGLQIDLPLVEFHESSFEGRFYYGSEKDRRLGLIGLLNCSDSTNTVVLGLAFREVTPASILNKSDRGTPKMVKCIETKSTERVHAVRISPTLANRAVHCKVVILHTRTQDAQLPQEMFDKFVIERSPSMKRMGYSPARAIAPSTLFEMTLSKELLFDSPMDFSTGVITRRGGIHRLSLPCVEFMAVDNPNLPSFAILILDKEAVVRATLSDLHRIVNEQPKGTVLKQLEGNYDNPVFQNDSGVHFEVKVAIDTKIVCSWKIHTVYVDVEAKPITVEAI